MIGNKNVELFIADIEIGTYDAYLSTLDHALRKRQVQVWEVDGLEHERILLEDRLDSAVANLEGKLEMASENRISVDSQAVKLLKTAKKLGRHDLAEQIGWRFFDMTAEQVRSISPAPGGIDGRQTEPA